ncbi:hypothetical protein AB0M45_29740 [Nocardia sp. NPDC051787]|uniref:hypothetical protein n=1 Tax=Nocardia sp. NPDC051787 TaxID=3155415 RepID=UPI0034483C7F
MTRELVYTGFMSLDGVVDSPGGKVEEHRSGGWVLDTEFVPEAFSLKAEELAETTALMFGRRSYEAFAAIWPDSEDHIAYKELPEAASHVVDFAGLFVRGQCGGAGDDVMAGPITAWVWPGEWRQYRP